MYASRPWPRSGATPSRQPASTASLAMRPGWGGRRRPSRSSTPTSEFRAQCDNRAGFKEVVARVCLARWALSSAWKSPPGPLQCRPVQVVRAGPAHERWSSTPTVSTIWPTSNDRILLGLKGQMSEAELHILAGRLQVPAGRRCPGDCASTTCGLCLRRRRGDGDGPRRGGPRCVADVFAAFAATGSAYRGGGGLR